MLQAHHPQAHLPINAPYSQAPLHLKTACPPQTPTPPHSLPPYSIPFPYLFGQTPQPNTSHLLTLCNVTNSLAFLVQSFPSTSSYIPCSSTSLLLPGRLGQPPSSSEDLAFRPGSGFESGFERLGILSMGFADESTTSATSMEWECKMWEVMWWRKVSARLVGWWRGWG